MHANKRKCFWFMIGVHSRAFADGAAQQAAARWGSLMLTPTYDLRKIMNPQREQRP